MIIKLMIWMSKWSRIRRMVSANIFVRSDNPEIKKITMTAPTDVCCWYLIYSLTLPNILPHLIVHSARI